jgi:glycosyltransferase involved in cell wall biosynthesis
VIHNGVDTDLFRRRPEVRERQRARYGVVPEEFCIGTVGRLEPVKDILTLLRAIGELAQLEQWRVLIAGAGSDLPVLQQFLRERPELCSRVTWLGEIQDVPDFLNSLDLYVLPSIYEGISNSLLEAMASGIAVAASDVGGNKEVIVDGECGLLFPVGQHLTLAERLKRLILAPETRLRLADKAVDRVRRFFSLDSMVQEYTQMYTEVFAKKRYRDSPI